MSPTAALTGALIHSVWQVAVPGALFALSRLVVKGATPRYLLGLATLAMQFAWPVTTFFTLLREPVVFNASESLATNGRWWWVPTVWVLGVVVMATRLVGGMVLVRRWVRDAAQLERQLLERFEALRVRLGVRHVRWGVLSRLDTPLTVGFWRPSVLLPASLLTALPVADLELLVAHELLHVRRWDYLFNVLQSLVESLLFFHPLVWWVSAKTRNEREYRCDDGVLHALGSAKDYALALLSLEEHRAPGAALAATGGDFKARVRRLARRQPRGSSQVPWLLIVVLGVSVVTAVAHAIDVAPRPAAIELPARLRPAIEQYCADVEATMNRAEIVAIPSKADWATVVLATVNEQTDGFEQFFNQVVRLPPAERLPAIKRSFSNATGRDWQCEPLDQLWNQR